MQKVPSKLRAACDSSPLLMSVQNDLCRVARTLRHARLTASYVAIAIYIYIRIRITTVYKLTYVVNYIARVFIGRAIKDRFKAVFLSVNGNVRVTIVHTYTNRITYVFLYKRLIIIIVTITL